SALVIAGPTFTCSVKLCTAGEWMPLSAVIVSGYVPAVPALGVPESVAVPSPLSTKFTPSGNAPSCVIVGAGRPVVVIGKGNASASVADVWSAWVMTGAPCRVSTKFCDAGASTPFVAKIVIGYVPWLPTAGVPAIVAVPSGWLTNESPAGSAPECDTVGVG